MIWYIVGGIVAVIVAFIWWRYTSVARGARQRDEKILPLLDPLGDKLLAGEDPTPREIEEVAERPSARSFLYELFKHYERLDLFPEEYRSESAQAEAKLVYWMMHPNELQDAPKETELVETVVRKVEGQDCLVIGLATIGCLACPVHSSIMTRRIRVSHVRFHVAATSTGKSSRTNWLIGLLAWPARRVAHNSSHFIHAESRYR